MRCENDSVNQLRVNIYSFVSTKTNKKYIVRLEDWNDDLFAVKFYLDRDKKNKNKYTVLTGYNEATTVLRTVLNIMIEFSSNRRKNGICTHFVVVGTGITNDFENNTKRFRIYSKLLQNLISPLYYIHYEFVEKSIYFLCDRNNLDALSHLISKLKQNFGADLGI